MWFVMHSIGKNVEGDGMGVTPLPSYSTSQKEYMYLWLVISCALNFHLYVRILEQIWSFKFKFIVSRVHVTSAPAKRTEWNCQKLKFRSEAGSKARRRLPPAPLSLLPRWLRPSTETRDILTFQSPWIREWYDTTDERCNLNRTHCL